MVLLLRILFIFHPLVLSSIESSIVRVEGNDHGHHNLTGSSNDSYIDGVDGSRLQSRSFPPHLKSRKETIRTWTRTRIRTRRLHNHCTRLQAILRPRECFSDMPSSPPSAFPTVESSIEPSFFPTVSSHPSTSPTKLSSVRPSTRPTRTPTAAPSARPSAHPSSSPTELSSVRPTLSQIPTVPPTSSQGPSQHPSTTPTSPPTFTPAPTTARPTSAQVGVLPGNLLAGGNDLQSLVTAQGLTARLVLAGQITFPAEAACFDDDDRRGFNLEDGVHKGWTYVINSCDRSRTGGVVPIQFIEESSSLSGVGSPKGGVYALRFDGSGTMTSYRVLEGTEDVAYCGGGPTPWGSWMATSQPDGTTWELPLSTSTTSPTQHRATPDLDGLRSMVCDDRNYIELACFVTYGPSSSLTVAGGGSAGNTPLRRYQPDVTHLVHGLLTGDFVGGTLGATGDKDSSSSSYLLLQGEGKFQWTTDLNQARTNAGNTYPDASGLSFDPATGTLYLVSRRKRQWLELDLDRQTYKRHNVFSPEQNTNPLTKDLALGLEGSPDVIAYLPNTGAGTDHVFLTETGTDRPGVYVAAPDLHNRRPASLLKGPSSSNTGGGGLLSALLPVDDTATGLAFCDRNHRMLVAFRESGLLYEVTRDDGRPFDGPIHNHGR